MRPCAKCGHGERAPSSAYCRPCKNAYERVRPRSSEYRRTPEHRAYMRDYIQKRRQTPSGAASALLNHAKTRSKHPVTISREWIVERLSGVCPLTGRQFDLTIGSKRRKPDAPSLDQIVPGGGYTPENTRVVVAHVNLALNEFGDAALLKLAQDIIRQLAAKPRKGKVQRSSRKRVGPSGPKCEAPPAGGDMIWSAQNDECAAAPRARVPN